MPYINYRSFPCGRMVEEEMAPIYNRVAQILLGAALFVSGVAAGSLYARSAAVQNRFGQPKTVLHVVVYKFRDDVSNYDQEKAINGIKDMAGKKSGHKKDWVETGERKRGVEGKKGDFGGGRIIKKKKKTMIMKARHKSDTG